MAPAAVMALGGACASLAAQWIVDDDGPADFRTIQQAINAVYVLSGDTILVRPGTYLGNVVLTTKDLEIRSESGPWRTILDAQESGSVVSLINRSGATRVEGFTITGGRDQTGGGIWIFGGSPVITRNLIQGNQATGGYLGYGYGGGIEIYGSAALISRNIIRGNSARDGGGGIDIYYSGPSTPGTCCPNIVQNTIVENVVTFPGGAGGGILCFASEPTISSSIIAGNVASLGGGIQVDKVQGNSDAAQSEFNILHLNLPDDAASNGNWRLSSSNQIVDPRLGAGEWTDLWPRSDSPALDAGSGALAPGPDLVGTLSPLDSDLDGVMGEDVGALEGCGEVSGLRVGVNDAQPGAAALAWDVFSSPDVVFNVYGSDGDPFHLSAGTCLAAALPGPGYTDAQTMAPGTIRFYLVTGEGALEGCPGFRSHGTPRSVGPACTP